MPSMQTPADPAGPLHVHTTFEDIHVLGKTAGFDLDFRCLTDGQPEVSAAIVCTHSAVVVDMHLPCGFHQRGMAPSGAVTVGIPRRGINDWCRRGCKENSLLPFNMTGGIDAVTAPDFAASTLSFSVDFFQTVAEENRLSGAHHVLDPVPGDVIADSEANRALRRRIDQLAHIPLSAIDDDIDLELALLLLEAASASDSGHTTASARARALAIALAYIEQREHEPLTVRELCQVTNTPVRTLNRAFRDQFGVGPKGYINRVRLSRVRRELLHQSSAIRIADTANRFGFWHMGQFARDYRRMFGELPSETAGYARG